MDLVNAEIAAEVWIDESWINGDLQLSGSHFSRLLSLQGTQITGDFRANDLHVGRSLFLRDGATFKGYIELRGAKSRAKYR